MGAKQGMLRLHDALPCSPSECTGRLNQNHQREKLAIAVRQAVEAEIEAQELLEAKQDLLSKHETALRKHDMLRLKHASDSVDNTDLDTVYFSDVVNHVGSILHVE